MRLPAFVPVLRHSWSDGQAVSAAPPWAAGLTWSGRITRCRSYLGLGPKAEPGDQAEGLPISAEHGHREEEETP